MKLLTLVMLLFTNQVMAVSQDEMIANRINSTKQVESTGDINKFAKNLSNSSKQNYSSKGDPTIRVGAPGSAYDGKIPPPGWNGPTIAVKRSSIGGGAVYGGMNPSDFKYSGTTGKSTSQLKSSGVMRTEASLNCENAPYSRQVGQLSIKLTSCTFNGDNSVSNMVVQLCDAPKKGGICSTAGKKPSNWTNIEGEIDAYSAPMALSNENPISWVSNGSYKLTSACASKDKKCLVKVEDSISFSTSAEDIEDKGLAASVNAGTNSASGQTARAASDPTMTAMMNGQGSHGINPVGLVGMIKDSQSSISTDGNVKACTKFNSVVVNGVRTLTDCAQQANFAVGGNTNGQCTTDKICTSQIQNNDYTTSCTASVNIATADCTKETRTETCETSKSKMTVSCDKTLTPKVTMVQSTEYFEVSANIPAGNTVALQRVIPNSTSKRIASIRGVYHTFDNGGFATFNGYSNADNGNFTFKNGTGSTPRFEVDLILNNYSKLYGTATNPTPVSDMMKVTGSGTAGDTTSNILLGMTKYIGNAPAQPVTLDSLKYVVTYYKDSSKTTIIDVYSCMFTYAVTCYTETTPNTAYPELASVTYSSGGTVNGAYMKSLMTSQHKLVLGMWLKGGSYTVSCTPPPPDCFIFCENSCTYADRQDLAIYDATSDKLYVIGVNGSTNLYTWATANDGYWSTGAVNNPLTSAAIKENEDVIMQVWGANSGGPGSAYYKAEVIYYTPQTSSTTVDGCASYQ